MNFKENSNVLACKQHTSHSFHNKASHTFIKSISIVNKIPMNSSFPRNLRKNGRTIVN